MSKACSSTSSRRTGQLVEQLAADSNCAIATFEEIANPGTTQQIDWTFTVS